MITNETTVNETNERRERTNEREMIEGLIKERTQDNLAIVVSK